LLVVVGSSLNVCALAPVIPGSIEVRPARFETIISLKIARQRQVVLLTIMVLVRYTFLGNEVKDFYFSYYLFHFPENKGR